MGIAHSPNAAAGLLVEFGVYFAAILSARYLLIIKNNRKYTGTTTISIISVDVIISARSFCAITPCGFNNQLPAKCIEGLAISKKHIATNKASKPKKIKSLIFVFLAIIYTDYSILRPNLYK